MSNSTSFQGFLMIELLMVLLVVSFFTLIIAQYQVLVIQWQQEAIDRLKVINYAHNCFADPIDTENNTGAYDQTPFTLQWHSKSIPSPSSGFQGLIHPDLTLKELHITWEGPGQKKYEYRIIGGICTKA